MNIPRSWRSLTPRARKKKAEPRFGGSALSTPAIGYFTIVVSIRVTITAKPSATFAPTVLNRLSTA